MRDSFGIRAISRLVLVALALPCYAAEPNAPAETTDLGQVLCDAVRAGNRGQVENLLDKGADVNVRDASGHMPIHYAVAGRHKNIIRILTDAAVQRGTLEGRELAKVKRLLYKGMNVNAKGPGGNTLLHFAAQTDYLYVAALLIALGADAGAVNDSGQTPLQIAWQHRHSDIAVLILEAHPGAFLQVDDADFVEWIRAADAAPNAKDDKAHDVCIASVVVSSHCTQGDSIPIHVVVENREACAETCEITLVSMTDKSRLAVRSTVIGACFQGGIQDSANLVFDPDALIGKEFGNWVSIGGDVNGDGFADMLICAPSWQGDRGRAYLYYGGEHVDTLADVVFTGERPGCCLGNQSGAFGDVNRDGYDDVIIGAPGRTWNDTTDGYVNVYYGGPNMDHVADVVLKGESGSKEHLGLMVATGDIDCDGYVDILAGAQGYDNLRGRVYLYWGGAPLDPMPDVIFEGERANSLFGRRIEAGGDVNGDGYGDILIGARQWGDDKCGRAYLFLGNARERMDAQCDCAFTGEGQACNMGSSLDIFDIDDDGIDDALVGARHAANANGQVYIYWGARDFDGTRPGMVLEGQKNSAMGGDMIECNYFNDDSYGDILAGAWRYPDWIYDHGRAYLFYGNTKGKMDTKCDHIFAGEGGTMDMFGCQVSTGDVNNDGYVDALISAQYADHGAGRCYLYYGPFSSSADITFTWDTTNASIGKHTLKVEIPPVPGEQNAEDNVKTVTIEVRPSGG